MTTTKRKPAPKKRAAERRRVWKFIVKATLPYFCTRLEARQELYEMLKTMEVAGLIIRPRVTDADVP